MLATLEHRTVFDVESTRRRLADTRPITLPCTLARKQIDESSSCFALGFTMDGKRLIDKIDIVVDRKPWRNTP